MTSETLKNPSVVLAPDTTGVDLAIRALQVRLAGLEWLEKSFGRAWPLPSLKGTERIIEPKVYQSTGEYSSVMPNDALKSYSFWRVRGKRTMKDWKPLTQYGNYYLSDPTDVIVWVNLKEIDKSKDYIHKETLIKNVLDLLNRDPNYTVTGIYDERVEDIFSGYTLQPHHRDLLMYPFAAFRIEGVLDYIIHCDPGMGPTPSLPPPSTPTPNPWDGMFYVDGVWRRVSIQELANKLADTPITL